MEKKVFKKVQAYIFICLICLPLIMLLFSSFRLGNFDLTSFYDLCDTCSIPFIKSTILGLCNILDIPITINPVVSFLNYFLSAYILYLIIDILVIALDMIHNLMHSFGGGK